MNTFFLHAATPPKSNNCVLDIITYTPWKFEDTYNIG